MAANRWGVDSLGAAEGMASSYQRILLCAVSSGNTPQETSEAFAAALGAGDLQAALAMWVEDPTIVQPDGRAVCGRDAIAAALQTLIDNEVGVKVHITSVFAAGEVAVGVGTTTMTVTGADGRPLRRSSRSTVIYHRDGDGRWRLAVDAPGGLPEA